MTSLTTAAGERTPRNGTISTCNQFSTTDPTTAPATSPPMVMTTAFPAEKEKRSVKGGNCEQREKCYANPKGLSVFGSAETKNFFE